MEPPQMLNRMLDIVSILLFLGPFIFMYMVLFGYNPTPSQTVAAAIMGSTFVVIQLERF